MGLGEVMFASPATSTARWRWCGVQTSRIWPPAIETLDRSLRTPARPARAPLDSGRHSSAFTRSMAPAGRAHVLDPDGRPQGRDLLAVENLAFDFHPRGVIVLAQQLLVSNLTECKVEGAALLVARRLPGLSLEVPEQLGGIFAQCGLRGAVAQLPNDPGGVPGRAAGQLPALKKYRFNPARGQVIERRQPDDPAADDDRCLTALVPPCSPRRALVSGRSRLVGVIVTVGELCKTVRSSDLGPDDVSCLFYSACTLCIW